MKRILLAAVPLMALALAPLAKAVTTEKIDYDTFAGFSAGDFSNVCLTSEGHLELAPAITNLADVADPIIWAAVQDNDGNVFLGTGNQGKVYKLDRKGKLSEFFAPNEIMVHALAIDGKGRLYAATSPNGRVYRLDSDGRAEVFCNPGETYIWAMTFGKDGALYLATGDKGKILRVPAGGSTPAKAEVYLDTPEGNITSLAWDADGNLLAGTSPHGYLYRIDKATNGFVLFNSGDTEIKQIAVAADGTIYASTFAGKSGDEKSSSSSSSSPVVILSGGMLDSVNSTPTNAAPKADENAVVSIDDIRNAVKSSSSSETSGTESPGAIYRIETNGYVQRFWSVPGEAIYSMLLLPDDDLLVGTGDKGRIYSISSPTHWKLLQQTADGAQVAALLPTRGDGQYFAATSHPGKLYRIDFALAARGVYTSKAFDANQKSIWGKIRPNGDAKLQISTRSGNTEKPEKTWSAWSAPVSLTNEITIASPAARYLQYRVFFERDADLRRFEFYYQNQNAAPVISRVKVFAEGFGVSKIIMPAPGEMPTSLEQLLGDRAAMQNSAQLMAMHPQLKMTRAPGLCTVVWNATDPNGDDLIYSVSIRGESETNWTTLVDRTDETFFSFDSTGFREGIYFVKVAASDEAANTPATARTAVERSDAFLIDNTPPVLTVKNRSITRGEARFTVDADDGASVISDATYSLDGKEEINVRPENLLFDSMHETFSIDLTDLAKGPHGLLLRVRDEAKNASVLKLNFEVR
ncbi:MAG TPA: hypothetical protein VFV23_07160 [Verrucomicrobiae bacterium]|nr:hypothetical protein [Verrucomicrobiae bacterium]